MKPVVRWTIGTRHQSAVNCMYHAIAKFKKIFKDKFRTVICTNHPHFKVRPEVVDEVIYQTTVQSEISLPPPLFSHCGGPAWKLYPGRLSLESHEIFIDNDLIIYKEPELFEKFLSSDNFLVTAAVKRSYSPELDHCVKSGFEINTGIIGLPPNYNFVKEINDAIAALQIKEWRHHFDEQTIVASLLQDKNVLTIPLDEISVWRHGETTMGKCGIHLTGLNYEDESLWQNYMAIKLA